MPETKRHLALRTALYDVLLSRLAPGSSVGSEQFVYWNARDPARCLAPDAFVKLDVPDAPFTSWKTWERGTPELAIEIWSESDDWRGGWADKLERYHELGVRELVTFDADAEPGARLRVWDRVDDDLVERAIEADASPCVTLSAFFVVGAVPGAPVALRLAEDAGGLTLFPTGREIEARARQEAEARVAALEEELRRRS
jgi:hypothetical protein